MSQTLLHLLQAMLTGLVEGMAATDAAIILPDSSATAPHLLVRIGRLTVDDWHRLLKEDREDLRYVPLRGHNTGGRSARLYVYREGKARWSEQERLAVYAIAAGVDYLLEVPGEEFNWMQLVASRRILSVTEEELCRIVLDIHDGPVQKLFAALNHLIHLQAILERAERAERTVDGIGLLPDLRHIVELLESSLGEIRTFLGAFQSAELAQRELLEVLEALVLQHEQLTNSTVHFESPAHFPPVSVPVKIALYRILQEALSNAHRHANVNEHFVRIWLDEEQIYMEVIDYGQGFTPPALEGPTATEAAQHIGLRGMRERVHLVGGVMQLESAPGEGTRIHVSVPIS